MGRGYIARIYRDKLKIQQESEAKARAKADRERKHRERKEAAEAAERRRKEQVEATESARRNKLKSTTISKAGGEATIMESENSGREDITVGSGADGTNAEVQPVASENAVNQSRVVDDNDSDGSDMYQEDSDEEDSYRRAEARGQELANPRELLAATAALDVRQAKSTGVSISGLSLGGMDGDGDTPLAASGKSIRATPSRLSRMKMDVLGSMTPRSARGGGSSFFASGRKGAIEGRKLFLSKMTKGTLVAASTVRISRRHAESGWQDRFVLLVGDVLFIFNLAAQPDFPLGLRLWPNQVVCLSQSSLAVQNSPVPVVRDGCFQVAARAATLGSLAVQGDDKKSMETLATAMHLGVSNVRRARQKARLQLAQQMCHEKKLSLLKTRHMIDLLHKSQEMFFEAGSGQFDDCNAVCMHSGVMRQSLIDGKKVHA